MQKAPEEMSEIQRYLLQQNENYADHARATLKQTEIKAQEPEINVATRAQDDLPPILQPAAQTIDAQPEPPPAAQPQQPKVQDDTTYDLNDLIDTAMLETLLKTLGRTQFHGLMQGFVDKADEIIANMEQCAAEQNIAALGARGHELKGMAGNFGMKKVSDIAGQIEKMAKTAQNAAAIAQAQMLNAAQVQTKAAFKNWLDSLPE